MKSLTILSFYESVTASDGYRGGYVSFVHFLLYFLLFLNQNICCGNSKEPSQLDGSFEHPRDIFK